MDGTEIDTRAAELLLIEVLPFIDPAALEDARRAIRAGLDAEIAEDERAIRRRALELIEDARGRYRGPAIGAVFPSLVTDMKKPGDV